MSIPPFVGALGMPQEIATIKTCIQKSWKQEMLNSLDKSVKYKTNENKILSISLKEFQNSSHTQKTFSEPHIFNSSFQTPILCLNCLHFFSGLFLGFLTSCCHVPGYYHSHRLCENTN